MQNNTSHIELVLDPLLDFRKSVAAPALRNDQVYTVKGYQGGGYDISTPQGRAANCHYAVNEAIEQGLASLGHTFFWAKGGQLQVLPEAGRMWNAYYNRTSLQFFFNNDAVNGRTTYASSAAKIVFHESGHAVLDGIRPDLYNMANFEIWSVHEAFGDLMAFLCTMRNTELFHARNKRVWTGIGLEFGAGIFKTPDSIYRPLRDLSVLFNWVSPSTIPSKGDDSDLLAEPHSFSRIFSSAIYSFFLKMLARNTSQGKPDPIGLSVTTLGRYLITGLSLSAINEFYMDSVARAIMYVDWRESSPYQDLLIEAFDNQNILRPQTKIAALSTTPHLTKQKLSTMCLADEMISAQSNNPLYNLKVHIGHDENSDRERIKEDVKTCLDYLHQNDQVNKPHGTFGTWEGELLRRHFDCRFH